MNSRPEEKSLSVEALHQNADHLRLVIDTIPAFVWCAGPDGSIEFLNQRGLDYTGFTLEQIRKWNWKDSNILHPDDLQGLFETWSAIVASGQPGEVQARMRRFDGEYRWFLFRVAPLRDEVGRLVAWWGVDLDIHDRIRAEDKLRQSEAYLAEAQRLSRTGSFGWNVATGALVWSEQTFCILGYDRTIKPTLELVFKRIHPDDVAFVRQTLDHATHNKSDLDFEHRLLMPDGSIKHVRVLAQPAKTEAGALEFVGAVMDITETKRAGEKLCRSQAYLVEAQKLSQVGSFCIIAGTGEIISSEETVRIGGWESGTRPTVAQAIERVHPDDRQRVQTSLEKALREETFLEYEHRLLLPDGTVRDVHTIANPMRNLSGEVEFVGAVMDITEKKKSKDALNAAKARFEGILEIAEDAIISVDSSQRIVLFNQGAQKVFGYAEREVMGRSLDLLLPQRFARAHRSHIGNFAKSAEISRLMAQRSAVFGRRKDGSEFPAEASISKLDLDGEILFTVILRDITEQKRLENRLRQSEKNLAEGQRLTKTGSWILDYHTGNTDWSIETCRIFGFPDPPPSPHYSEFRARVRPEDREAVDRGLRESFETGEPRPLEYIFMLPDGVRKNIETISQPVKDETGTVLRLMGTVMDVTERVKVQEALRKSEAYLTEAQCLSRTGSFSWKPASGEVLWSAEMFRIFGFDPSVKPTLELARQRIHPDDVGIFAEKVRSGLQEGKDLEYEHRLLMPDGTIKWLQVVARAARDESDKVEYIGALMDITERAQAAEALRASEHLARGQLAALTRTLDSLAQETDPDKLPKHVVTALLNQMSAHSATIWERNGDALDLLGIVAEGGFKTSIEAGYFGGSVPIFENVPPLWGDALQSGMHFVIEDISIDPARVILADGRSAVWPTAGLPAPFADLKKHFIAGGVRALLISPMMMAGQLAGIIGIRFTGTRVFEREEIELTKALAQQAMLAIQLMRLSQQSRQTAVMAERNRMAREIHDTLAQGFTGVIMQLEAAKGATKQGDPAEAEARIERAGELARSSLGEARRSVRALRPSSLRNGRLFMTLDNLLKRMTEGTDLNADFRSEGDERAIPAEYEDGLLRITQESLTNAVKHANARNFKATLSVGAKAIQLQLVDDGRGFDPHTEHEGFGLIGMKERVEQMNGEFIIRAKPGVGTEILVMLKNQSAVNPENGND